MTEQKRFARYTAHKHQPGQIITNPCIYLQKQDNSYSKSYSVKRLEETGTPPRSIRRILCNEALTDGPGLTAHPETDRTHSDNLYHSDNPHWEKVELGRGQHGLKDKAWTRMAPEFTLMFHISSWYKKLSENLLFYDTRLTEARWQFTETLEGKSVDEKKREGKQGCVQKRQVIV